MKISVINTGYFKLDGGAMFGIVPKRMWAKLNPPDENNLCTWIMRCLLIETQDRKILIDTGMGDKQDAKFRSHFEPHGNENITQSLANQSITPDDITDVILTHLHFDHCGSAVTRNTEGVLVPTFPNATYWSNQTHYKWALNPNAKEVASFLNENFVPLKEHNVLRFIEEKEGVEFHDNITIHFTYGHTEAMMMVKIKFKDKILIFCADTMPSQWHIGMPYVMAYDIRPMETLKEKEKLLSDAAAEGWYLYFEHDPTAECATVKKDEKGRIVLNTIHDIKSIFS